MIHNDGDLASSAARQLQRSHVTNNIPAPEDEGSVMRSDGKRSVFAKIDFKWRSHDEMTLTQIRQGLDHMFRHMYDQMKEIVDDIYMQMRVPEFDEDTGLVAMGRDGRVVWQKDRKGNYVEDWNQLTGQDIETALFSITRLKLDLAPRVNNLLNEALFAKHIYDDASYDAYSSLIEGTVKDREAFASQNSRDDKYHAFYRYYLWSQADTFMKELNNFARILERVRYWRIDDSGKTTA